MRTNVIIRGLLVGIPIAVLSTVAAIPSASASPVTTTAREVLTLDNGWYSNTPVTTTVDTQSEDVTRTKTEATTETRTTATNTAQVLPPINSDGTSVWPAKRGVIPVQFKVNAATKTETRTVTTPYTAIDKKTTTTTTKTPAFESVCNTPDDRGYSVIGLYGNIPAGTTVANVTRLSADFDWLEGQSMLGSLRWDIGTEFGDVHVYYGGAPNWIGHDGSGANLMTAIDNRFDDSNTSVIGGTFYNTKVELLSKLGDAKVNNVSLAVDSCWGGQDQRVNVSSASVQFAGHETQSIFSPSAARTTSTSNTVAGNWVAGSPVPGEWTTTSSTIGTQSNTAPAKLVVQKYNDGILEDVLTEELSSAQGDVGGNFRQVDGKYIYNLQALDLGKGDFKVFINIGGVNLPNPGVFTLK